MCALVELGIILLVKVEKTDKNQSAKGFGEIDRS